MLCNFAELVVREVEKKNVVSIASTAHDPETACHDYASAVCSLASLWNNQNQGECVLWDIPAKCYMNECICHKSHVQHCRVVSDIDMLYAFVRSRK